ncbi:MAG: type IV pilus twitching motility protein PilT, partial [Planctomycetota bacterium]
MDLTELLTQMMDSGASDLHLQAGDPPRLRKAGHMVPVSETPLTDDEIRTMFTNIAMDDVQVRLDENRAVDFSFEVSGQARFRVNAFYERNRLAMAFRLVPLEIPPFDELNLPSAIAEIALSPRGLVLVTGTTGSGKSTTLAAMIDYINRTRQDRIITIEDPIEFIHTSKESLIAHRELGPDTPTFIDALRTALRQDPDVILVGELRDVVTTRVALQAADTGHIVYSTMHTTNAAQTVQRLIALFPPEERELLLLQLA